MSQLERSLIALFAAAAISSGGCLFSSLASSSGPTTQGMPWEATYVDQPGFYDCARQNWPHDVGDHVLSAMCEKSYSEAVPMDELLPTDPDKDPIDAAVAVALCASRDCDVDSREADDYLAAASDLVTRTDPAAVQRALADGKLSPQVQQDFLRRYLAARDRVKALVAKRDAHWRRVFVQPALDARAARAAHDKVLAPWKARVDAIAADADRALVAGTPAAKTLEAALTLRRAYVEACQPERGELAACLADGVGRRLAQMIQHLAEIGGDSPLAQAEEAVLKLADRSDPISDVYWAAHVALQAEIAQRDEWEAARDRAGSEAALAERWPETPYELTKVPVLLAPAPAYDAQDQTIGIPSGGGSSGTEVVNEQVRSIKRKGDSATVLLRRDVQANSEGTGCRQTNRITSIGDDGQVNYDTVCTGTRHFTSDYTKKPVEVPWIEVASVKPGETIQVVVDEKSRRGHVVFVGAVPPKEKAALEHYNPWGKSQVQMREFRIAAAKQR